MQQTRSLIPLLTLPLTFRFGVRHPITQNFPRKFKTAFTGCPDHDSVAAAIQDLTYVAQIREEGGVQKKGFKVYVGGGTSIMPRLAKPLYEFIPEAGLFAVGLGYMDRVQQCRHPPKEPHDGPHQGAHRQNWYRRFQGVGGGRA